MKKNILCLIPTVVICEPTATRKPNIDGLKYVFGLGAGGMQQNDTLKAREDNGEAFVKNQHPYAVNTALVSAHLGVRYYQGMAYLGAYSYGLFAPLNKEVYRSVFDHDEKDYISVKTTGAVGIMGQAGLRFNDITPYAILGIQYGPRSLTYTAEKNGTTTKKTYKNKQPVFIFGLGVMGHASDNVTIGLELYRKVSYDFTVKLPDAGGNIRLSGDFLTVKTARWAVQGVVSFEF
ncbi:MAG: hypothetical protein COY39_01650 [Alphaproteobacteria bacterium CG_4_10_14_0_8_um_filter_37_21]|nr:MAG: hypothetical protein COY39_01650 [Alphaproteobacteria bacterium CG_4_10_14_0_8_um_filter_37_21]